MPNIRQQVSVKICIFKCISVLDKLLFCLHFAVLPDVEYYIMNNGVDDMLHLK